MQITHVVLVWCVFGLGMISCSVVGRKSTTMDSEMSNFLNIEKSDDIHWNETVVFSNSSISSYLENSNCNCNEPLNYTTQYCIVNSSGIRDCLVQKALKLTGKTCLESKELLHPADQHYCGYAEICIFAVPESAGHSVECDYNCSYREKDTVDCEPKSGDFESFTSQCIMSFLHCPRGIACDYSDNGTYLKQLFQESGQCSDIYENELGLSRNKSWYWINQLHYNNRSFGFGHLRVVYKGPEYVDKCPHVEPILVKGVSPWLFSIPVFVAALVAVGYFGLRRYRKLCQFPDPDSSTDDPLVCEMQRIFNSGDSPDRLHTNRRPETPEIANTILDGESNTTMVTGQEISQNDVSVTDEGSILPLNHANNVSQFPIYNDQRNPRVPLPSLSSSVDTNDFGSAFSDRNVADFRFLKPEGRENVYVNSGEGTSGMGFLPLLEQSGCSPMALTNASYMETIEQYPCDVQYANTVDPIEETGRDFPQIEMEHGHLDGIYASKKTIGDNSQQISESEVSDEDDHISSRSSVREEYHEKNMSTFSFSGLPGEGSEILSDSDEQQKSDDKELKMSCDLDISSSEGEEKPVRTLEQQNLTNPSYVFFSG